MTPEPYHFHVNRLGPDALYAKAMENAGFGIVFAHVQEHEIEVNRALPAMLGYSDEEFSRLTISDIAMAEDDARDRELFAAMVAGHCDTYQLLKRYIHKHGHTVWGQLTMTMLRTGEPDGGVAVGMIEDVSERVRAEQALERQAAILRAQMEAAIDGILIVDAEARIVQYNQRFAELWGIPAEVIAKRCDRAVLAFVRPQLIDPEAFQSRIEALYADPEARSCDTLALKDGRVFDRYSAPALGADGTAYGRVWYFRDVTERMRAEASLREHNQRLMELDRLKSSFVDAVSHELRTPLTAILGFAEFLEDGLAGELNPGQRAYVDQIREGTLRLRRLVDDLLDFARMEAGNFRLQCAETPLGERILETVRSLAPVAARRQIALEARLPDPAVTAWADGGRLEQVLTNLIGNAIKFTAPGGRVVVQLRDEGLHSRIAIEDSGIGIPGEHLAHLFDKFYQVDPSLTREAGGAGLGLAIAKALVEAQGGTIGVDSEPGRGSTFWFTVPRHPA